MDITGNAILITGGNSGIGREMARVLHAKGNEVIVTGRNRATLDATVAANPGMAAHVLDMSNAAAIRDFGPMIARAHPKLNVVILNAGIMKNEDWAGGAVDLDVVETTIATNLLGPIRLIAALLPQLLGRPGATIVTVSSGLAFVPVARAPTYCATKAAIHSLSQTLRGQLRETGVKVIEWAPPLVATDLQPDQKDNPRAMPLEDFITESVGLLEANPAAEEIIVARAKLQRDAEREGRYGDVFAMLNPTG